MKERGVGKEGEQMKREVVNGGEMNLDIGRGKVERRVEVKGRERRKEGRERHGGEGEERVEGRRGEREREK